MDATQDAIWSDQTIVEQQERYEYQERMEDCND